jgi:4-diphosphocytidyl-2-C-methyl-D-erythritol kinase
LDAEISRGFNGFCDRVWNIVQFEIEKNFCAGSADRTHNLGTFGGVELEADFEKRDFLTQLLDESQSGVFGWHIQRHDYLLSHLCHSDRSGGISSCFCFAGLASTEIVRDVSTSLDMTKMQVLAPAKINLSLRVLGKRDDGFHEIETLISPISLADKIEIERQSRWIDFSCDDPTVPSGDENLVVRAAKAFFEKTKINSGIGIKLNKKIPHGAGLGGGSSDAAATLRALNQLFETKLSREELANLGSTIGSDVAFFLFESTAACKGRGEIVNPTKLKKKLSILLLKPGFSVSSAWAYSRWQDSKAIPGVSYQPQNVDGQSFVNDLERPVFEKFVFLAQLKKWLLKQAEVGVALMSGSGSTVFAVLRPNVDVDLVVKRARDDLDREIWTCASETI